MLFRNKNFVQQLAEKQGINYDLSEQTSRSILFIVQNQTRLLLQHATLLKQHFNQQTLLPIHLNQSLQQLGIPITLSNYQDQQIQLVYNQNVYRRKNQTILRVQDAIQKELRGIYKTKNQIKGRWLYLQGVVPQIQQNINVKTLSSIIQLKNKQQQQKQNKFNVIRDKPLALLTKQQEAYYNQIINFQVQINQLTHNILPLVPFLLSYILSNSCQATLSLLLALIHNVYINDSLEYWGHQVIGFLLGYNGIQLAKLVNKWEYKYKGLYQVGNVIRGIKEGGGWNGQIKKLGWSFIRGQQVNVSNLRQSLYRGQQEAIHFSHLLKQCIGGLKYKQQYYDFLQDGLCGLQDNHYGYTFL